jgi:hypothetical protein
MSHRDIINVAECLKLLLLNVVAPTEKDGGLTLYELLSTHHGIPRRQTVGILKRRYASEYLRSAISP